MPSISRKGMMMPESPIRKLAPYADEARRKGIKVYNLNIGQPDIRTPEIALDAVRNISQTTISYGHSAGNESYRRKLADKYRHLGIDVDYSQILITTGGSEAVFFALMSTVDPDEEIIIPEPFYANYYGFSISAGIRVIPVISKIEDGFALPPVEVCENLITPKTRGILISNPNNPTGYLYSREELEQLGEFIKKHDLYLYCDEVYREFCYDGASHFSSMKLNGVDQQVIMIDSISKRYSACGARVGALVTRNKDIIDTALKFGQARLSPPALGQILGEAAIDTPQTYFDEVYDEYVNRRNFLVDALNKMPGVICPLPRGAFYATVGLPVDDSDKFSQWLLRDFNWKGQTVMLAPATGFYSNPELGRHQVRIAYVLKIEDLMNAMECLSEALKIYPGRI
jgi:aspartate aminotransferase